MLDFKYYVIIIHGLMDFSQILYHYFHIIYVTISLPIHNIYNFYQMLIWLIKLGFKEILRLQIMFMAQEVYLIKL